MIKSKLLNKETFCSGDRLHFTTLRYRLRQPTCQNKSFDLVKHCMVALLIHSVQQTCGVLLFPQNSFAPIFNLILCHSGLESLY